MNDETERLIQQIKIEKDVLAKARIIHGLKYDKDVKTSFIARSLGFSPAYVSNILRLLKLPPIVLDGYYSHSITVTHLFIISRLHSEEEMIRVYEDVLKTGMSTQELEEIVREKLYSVKSHGEKISPDVKKRLIEKFKAIDSDLDIKIVQTRIKSKITLEVKGSLKKTSEILTKLSR